MSRRRRQPTGRVADVLAGAGGFTLAELLVVTAILAMILAGLVGLLRMSGQGALQGSHQVEAQQNARVAMARLVQEVRAAGLDPQGKAFPAISAANPSGLTLQNDWNGNGAIEPGVTVTVNGIPRGEQVTYALAGTNLTRQESAVDAAAVVLASGVEQLLFQYLDKDGNPTGTPANIRTVLITLTTRPEQQGASALGRAQVVLVDRARLRNR